MRAYPHYRDSGVEWLGEVPEHWEVSRIAAVARRGTDTFTDGDWVELPYITDSGIRLIQTGNVGIGSYREQGFRYIDESSFDELRCTEIDPGDVLICRLADPVGRACLAPALGVRMITSVDVCILKPSEQFSATYIVYLLSSKPYLDYVESLVRGGTRDRISRSMLGAINIANPPLDEQRAIAAYLDRETERIDALVAKKRLLIERLDEYRTALITRTVTRGLPPEAARAAGLDPSPRLKPSGVEWLGEVPEHWEVGKVALAARRIQAGSTPPTANDEYYEDGTVPWFGPSAFRVSLVLGEPTKLLNEVAICNGVVRRFEAGTVMVVTIGATVGKVGLLATPASCNQQVTGITFNERMVIPTFAGLQLSLLGDLLKGIAPAATLPILSQSDIGHLAMLIPPLDEQRAIVAYLYDETELIDALVVRTEAATERLQEYRTALITAAVTGKIDVRE